MIKKIVGCCRYTIMIIWAIIIFYLTFLSLRGTSTIAMRNTSPQNETPIYEATLFYLVDNPWKHMFFFGVFILIYVLMKNYLVKYKLDRCLQDMYLSSKIWKVILLIFILSGIYYVMSTQLIPNSDPHKLLVIANEMHEGDFHQFCEGEYMYRYPFQSGFLLILYYIMGIFEDKTFMIMQLLNVVALGGIYHSVSRIVAHIWKTNSSFVMLLQIIFIPMLLYSTFVYGILLSFCLAMYAVFFEYLFFETNKMIYAFSSAVLISLSILLKSNSLIIFCAMLIFAVYHLIITDKMRWKKGIYIVSLIFFYFLGNCIVKMQMQSITDMELSKGMPKSAWIAMGLTEGGMAPGYWNGMSVSLYTENNYNYEKTNQAAFEIIESKLKKYVKEWRSGLDFLGRKVAAEWNEPTFQGISISRDRESETDIPKWIYSIYQGEKSIHLTEALNILQSWIYIGVCLYIITNFRKNSIEELFFAVIMIGGFLFHLFWEGKSQYVMCYFFLLIPYAVFGYQSIVNNVLKCIKKIRVMQKKDIVRKIGLMSGMIILSIFLIPLGKRFTQSKTYQYTLGVKSSDELLKEYEMIRTQIEEEKQ